MILREHNINVLNNTIDWSGYRNKTLIIKSDNLIEFIKISIIKNVQVILNQLEKMCFSCLKYFLI